MNSPQPKNSAPRVASFFSGIGGFELAFQMEGFETVFQCEKNQFCQSILRRHWPEAELHEDIQTASGAKCLRTTSIWTAGFPCQDVSLARVPHGSRQGLSGNKTGLFHRFVEIVSLYRPPILLLENVTGLLNSNKGRDFFVVVQSLLKLGYGVSWRVVNSRYFGAPQSRPRIFICASLDNIDVSAAALFESKPSSFPKHARAGFMTPSPGMDGFPIVPQVSFCLSATSARHTGMDWARSYISYQDRVRRLTPTECEGLQGFPVGWTIPPNTENTESVDTPRYHALGNAVTVDVVRWIASNLKQALVKHNQMLSSSQRSLGWPARPQMLRASVVDPVLRSEKSTLVDFSALLDEQTGFRWMSGGVAFGGQGLQARVGPAPHTPISRNFGDIVERGPVNERYFLSPNAADGILKRVARRGRTLFPPLQAALERLTADNVTRCSA